jgi:hypothetical protein
MTGFFRDGCCNTSSDDSGSHTVCVQLTDVFLQFSITKGNDLSSPRPEFNFPGLKAGDKWCVCAARWKEAAEEGVAPPVLLKCTHESALNIISKADLTYHALTD